MNEYRQGSLSKSSPAGIKGSGLHRRRAHSSAGGCTNFICNPSKKTYLDFRRRFT